MRLVFTILILLFMVGLASFSQPAIGQPPANQATNAQATPQTAGSPATATDKKEKTFSQSLKQDYPWCVLGILLSIVLPMLRRLLPKTESGEEGISLGYLRTLWPAIKPYVIIGLFSVLTGILVLAFAGSSLSDERAAILAGYAWDSTLQKLAAPKN